MSDLSSWLVLGALLLPLVGGVLARLVAPRFGFRAARIIGGGAFVGAVLCLLGVQYRPPDAKNWRLGVFLPSSAVVIARDSLLELPSAPAAAVAERATAPSTSPTAAASPTAATPTATVEPTATAAASPTSEPSATAEPTATTAPTATTVPTATPLPPTATSAPTAAPTETPRPAPTSAPTSAPARQPQRYIVEQGDTLRSIAERFDISVEALLRYNGLSPEEGDSLRVDQELFIPPR